MSRIPAATCVLATMLVVGCAALPRAPAAPALRLQKCGIADLAEPLLCGDLVVPEDRAKPGGRTIALNVVIVPATGEKTLPPLYDLAGGPGVAATGAAPYWAGPGAAHRKHRDIVLVDQRGTGASAPLPCPVFLSNPFAPVLEMKVVQLCRERYALVDLSLYSTAAAVADLDAVRAALGHDRIDLQGLSYGSRVAQEYLRAHPDRVRAMVLLGTLSPNEKMPLSTARNAQGVLVRLAQHCREDKRCRKAVPDLTRAIGQVDRKFAGGPVTATLANGAKVTLERGPFWEAVRAQLGTTAGQRRLPWLLHEAAQGRFAPILAAMAPRPDQHANGLLLSVSCAEDTLHITDEELEAQRNTVFDVYRVHEQIAACHAWGVPPAPRPAGFVESDVPVLLMAGDMDAMTPVAQAQDVAARLPNARLVVIPGLGHFPDGLANMECYDRIIAEFFAAGSAAGLDLDCLRTMRPGPFVTEQPKG